MDYVKICYCTKITPYPQLQQSHCVIKSAGRDNLLNSKLLQVQTMFLLDVIHICEPNDNTLSPFYRYGE